MTDEMKRNQLIEEIEQLKAQQSKLKEEIDIIEQKDERLRAKHRVGDAKSKLYWRMPVSYLETVFYTKKELIEKENDVCLMEKEFGHIISNRYEQYKNTFHMAVLCEDIIETNEGYCLALRDPYKRVLSNPLTMKSDTAYSLKGKILYVDFTESEEGKNHIFVKRWKTTSLTLNGYYGEQEKVTNSIAKTLLEFKQVDNENDAISAITMMQNYFRMKEKECKVLRMSPTEIRILQHISSNDAILYAIKFLDGEFWLFTEKGETGTHCYTSETVRLLERDFFGGQRSGDYVARERWAFRNAKETGEDIPCVEDAL